MRTTKRLLQVGAIGATAIGAVAALAPETPIGRASRRLARRLERDVRYAVASAPGIVYRLSGRRPDPDVSDDILRDRIRSTIGPLEHKLDVPRIHVIVEDHVAILHGDVAGEADAVRLEIAVLGVSGVEGVESHLHPRLIAGDSRPSDGARVPRPPSAALAALLDSASREGAKDPRRAVHAVLCAFSDRIPPGERAQFIQHLPADVRDVMGGARRHGRADAPRLRTLPQLLGAVVAEGGVEPERAEAITRGVVATLRTFEPDEAHDVSSVLPSELRLVWDAGTAPQGR